MPPPAQPVRGPEPQAPTTQPAGHACSASAYSCSSRPASPSWPINWDSLPGRRTGRHHRPARRPRLRSASIPQPSAAGRHRRSPRHPRLRPAHRRPVRRPRPRPSRMPSTASPTARSSSDVAADQPPDDPPGTDGGHVRRHHRHRRATSAAAGSWSTASAFRLLLALAGPGRHHPFLSGRGTTSSVVTGAITSAVVFCGILITGCPDLQSALLAHVLRRLLRRLHRHDLYRPLPTAGHPIAATTAVVCLAAATGILLLTGTLPSRLDPPGTPGEIRLRRCRRPSPSPPASRSPRSRPLADHRRSLRSSLLAEVLPARRTGPSAAPAHASINHRRRGLTSSFCLAGTSGNSASSPRSSPSSPSPRRPGARWLDAAPRRRIVSVGRAVRHRAVRRRRVHRPLGGAAQPSPSSAPPGIGSPAPVRRPAAGARAEYFGSQRRPPRRDHRPSWWSADTGDRRRADHRGRAAGCLWHEPGPPRGTAGRRPAVDRCEHGLRPGRGGTTVEWFTVPPADRHARDRCPSPGATNRAGSSSAPAC